MATTASNHDGGCAVDIRVFLLTLVLSIFAAFFAGVSCVPPLFVVASLSSLADKTNDVSRKLVPPSASPSDLSSSNFLSSLDHSPSGQHVLVDIQGIEAAFLDSEERLAAAMVQTVEEAGLTMLSYHCHKLDPAGISCVGVLLESHISFHTWPEEGVITLDLFTCGANPLLPVIPVIERLFGIGETINTRWAHELRGFRSMEEKKKNYLDSFSDLSLWILSPIEIHKKQMIYSNLTRYQRVDIWDLTEPENEPTYYDGLKHNLKDGDPRWKDRDYYTPDRALFLDGVLQSLYSHASDYHEALVHPAMFAHPSPVHVGIIGGGEGATLREVLKHKTVDHVTMIEIDSELIQIARDYLPEMSDCGNLVGRAENCFDDEIVEMIVNENGVQWFVDRYSPGATKTAHHGAFDVIIIDALDPEDDVPFTTDLYVDDVFVSSIMKSLSYDGVIMIQIGTAPELLDPKADIGIYQIREKLLNLFEDHPDVAAMHVYEEPRSGYLEPHAFMVVCKHVSCRSRWYARSDAIDYEIFDRTIKTKSGEGALKYFDGITQHSYQSPPMSWEAVYCRREPTPSECAYRSLDFTKDTYEIDLKDESKSSFKVELAATDAGVVTRSSVFAAIDIPKGSFIMPGDSAKSLTVSVQNIEDIKKRAENGVAGFEDFVGYLENHANPARTEGSDISFVEVGGTTLIRVVDEESDANVGRWAPAHPSGKRPAYSPVYDRHRVSFDVFLVATQDIQAGAELLRFHS
ncbi:Polyamine aminopropyltransferase [Seminavis robusta]|uniref:Polyamine aminopropyltransferase n=1 Tax=Seminavis robusta TaxID=568900 RepID=A0A9N8EQP5_9STRA|nr:Polyamine aminopropyltransferase [Seminavis robusta]|eukprot:Sro1358_g265890.1 Polyamine aminopropyltransferase (745) ;mRNA; f:18801-21122